MDLIIRLSALKSLRVKRDKVSLSIKSIFLRKYSSNYHGYDYYTCLGTCLGGEP
jgi:hypothetical protein